MRQLKLATAVGLLLAALVVIVQNWSPVKTNLLVWTIEPPLAALLIGTLMAGYGLGLLTTALMRVRTWRSEALAARKLAALEKGESTTGIAPVSTTPTPVTKTP